VQLGVDTLYLILSPEGATFSKGLAVIAAETDGVTF